MKLTVNEDEYNFLINNYYLTPASENRFIIKLCNSNKDVRNLTIELVRLSNNHKDKNISNIEEWIDDWRSAWAGKREKKSMGDRNNCIKNMREFLSNYKYTVDDVYEARDAYINSFSKDIDNIRQADYFIKKTIRENGTLSIVSDLLSVCQEREILKSLNKTEYNIYEDL